MNSLPKPMLALPTHQAALLQAAAYRNLNTFWTKLLMSHGLTVSEWTVLGLIATKPQQPSAVAAAMVVKTPFISRLIRTLVERGYIDDEAGTGDQRTKLLRLTPQGTLMIEQIELRVRQAMREYLHDVSREELETYIRVLAKLAIK